MSFNVSFRFRDKPTIEDIARERAFANVGHQWIPIYPRSMDLVLTPVEASELVVDELVAEWEALAIGLVVKHPEWTVKKIAEYVGVNRTSLYRSAKFKSIRTTLREIMRQELLANLPGGEKVDDPDNKQAGGHLEAWYEDDDEESE